MKAEKTTKNTLITKVYERNSMQLKDVRTIINSFLDCLTESLNAGERVEIRGLGVFETEKRGGDGRKRFNLQENKVMELGETFAVVFTPSKNLKPHLTKLNTGVHNIKEKKTFERSDK